MAEFWTSQARKWCKYCECWISDNPSSVAFHENGKKHKEMIQAVLKKVRIESNASEKVQSKQDAMLAKIEAAARGAFKKDVAAGHATCLVAGPSLTAPAPPLPSGTSAAKTEDGSKKEEAANGLGCDDKGGEKRDSKEKSEEEDPPPSAPKVIDENTGMSKWETVTVPIVGMNTLGNGKKKKKRKDEPNEKPKPQTEEEPVSFSERKLEGGLKKKRGEPLGPVAFKKRKRPKGK